MSPTSIDDIRRASGASVGSIYHHFGGKEGVAAELYVRALRDYQGGVTELLRPSRERARASTRWCATTCTGSPAIRTRRAALAIEESAEPNCFTTSDHGDAVEAFLAQ